MTAPITAADLAEALRSLVDGTDSPSPSFVSWHKAKTALCDWDAQQAEARKLATAVKATGFSSVFVVKLQEGCWFADGDGAPPMTLFESKAKLFVSRHSAKRALSYARKFMRFPDAETVEVKLIGGT